MPRYDYKCTDGHTHEEYMHMGEVEAAVPCECGKEAVRQFPKGTTLRFGADPYERDYREMEANGEFR